MLQELIKKLQEARNPQQAVILQRFFKTGVGEYGEGDKFLGIKVPIQKEIAKKYSGLNIAGIQKLLDSKIHEYRLVGLLILVNKFKHSDENGKGDIFNFYLKNTKNINNWDLVDLTSHKIVGEFLKDKKRDKLYELAESKDLWEKRISIISCFVYIKDHDFKDALRISEILLNDKHDLIHKAVGWMLREIGKKDQQVLEDFLKKHYKNMPRTMLRYAIERFREDLRKKYLKGEV
ncbi:MAG: DNA alkylation repair protein [Nanoarchaeota archaeon]|nr:DNA alkylation repair protein [Nanoarchaeota archaeon]MBU1028423.1 DNA alkylation repair protein [Nanoarchaeota archaeon]